MPRLKLNATGAEQSFELPQSGRYRIGRSNHCDLQLDDPSVSEQHCEIYLDPLMVMVTDLGSTNGTFVDGQSVQKQELGNGQVIHVGAYAMRIELESQRVVVPGMQFGQVERPTVLADGRPCCRNHVEQEATMRCTGCGQFFCRPCVHVLGLVGSKKHAMCPSCRQPCEAYTWAGGQVRRGFLGGILETVKSWTSRLR